VTRPDRAEMFLAGAALGMLNTLNARRPFARRGVGSVASFLPGSLTSELPLHAIVWQALATSAFVRGGALRSPPGLAGFALATASWAMLAGIHAQACRARDLFDTSLPEAFDRSGGELVDVEATDLDWRQIAGGPLIQRRRRYVATDDSDISYGDAGRRNRLDVWRSPTLPRDAGAPVLVQVHGGAWVISNKQQATVPLMAHMCHRGWVCVAINYRTSPRATWPDHIVDVKRAVAWVKANIDRYGGDPGFVAITGGSSGGHLAALAALTPNEAAFQPGFEDADTSIGAAVPLYGVYDFLNRDGTGRADLAEFLAEIVLKIPLGDDPDRWDAASPVSWVTPDAPPMMVIHGGNDSLFPVEQARSFATRLLEVSANPVVFAELPGAQHGFDLFASPRSLLSASAVHRFLESVRQAP
jgi:acetyl esterase/lipase